MFMRRALRYSGIVLAGLLLGAVWAWWAITQSVTPSLHNGAWRVNPLVGSAEAGLYSRAQAVAAGPLALNQSEALYFVATTDDQGQPLLCNRQYQLQGGTLDARWWSVTAYDASGFLIPNGQNRYSYASTHLERGADGGFMIHLSRFPQPGNWIPTGDGTTFFLALRLYNPAPSVRAHLTTVALPHIQPQEGTR